MSIGTAMACGDHAVWMPLAGIADAVLCVMLALLLVWSRQQYRSMMDATAASIALLLRDQLTLQVQLSRAKLELQAGRAEAQAAGTQPSAGQPTAND